MPALPVIWGPALKKEYLDLFASCKVHENRKSLADIQAKRIYGNKPRYEAIGSKLGIPWWVIGVLHLMECGLRFDAHLHNGDPLTDYTKKVPTGRPRIPGRKPPFTFEESAADALRLLGFDKIKDWSVAYVLYRLEGFNGYGYRQYHPNVKSPYLWSFTNHYVKGKYVADGKWNSETVSQQLGIAAVIKRLVELGYVKL